MLAAAAIIVSLLFAHLKGRYKKMRLLLALVLVFILVAQPSMAQSDNEIKQRIIEQSIRNYSGNCPCPYNTDRAGRKCGKRSAYSRPGGASPVCYPKDVTQNMIDAYQNSVRR